MMMSEAFCMFMILLTTTACQFHPELANPTDEMYGDRTAKMYIHPYNHHFSKNYDVYVDKNKTNITSLDTEGIILSYGSHSIDIIDKRNQKNIKHIDLELKERENHFHICETSYTKTEESKNKTCLINIPH